MVTTVFIAGTMQGAKSGVEIHDQRYRTEIQTILQRVSPGVEVFDPSSEVQRLLANDDVRKAITAASKRLTGALRLSDLPPQIQEVREAFLQMTDATRQCDLCIAYLPDRTLSMGTAMEIYAAHLASVPVVTVTDMVSNLAIASVSTWIVPDLSTLENLLLSELPRARVNAAEAVTSGEET